MTRRRLTLVRHAMPHVDLTAPPHTWQLSDDGARAARALVLPSPHHLVASDEPKAIQTIAWAGDVATDVRFSEIARRTDERSAGWRELRRRYVSGEDIHGWKLQADVATRFNSAMIFHLRVAAASHCHLVVATHGMALTAWLGSLSLVADRVSFWDELRLPDVLAVDLDDKSVRRVP